MKKGYKVTTRTMTEFLNETFGTTHKRWMKSTHSYDDETVIWMIRIDQEERAGFKNYFEDGILLKNLWINQPDQINLLEWSFR